MRISIINLGSSFIKFPIKITKIIFNFIKNTRVPDIGLVVFSLLFLYFTLGYAIQVPYFEKAVLVCIGPIFAWWLRWHTLDKNYRQIAVFWGLVFSCCLIALFLKLFQFFM